jgi:hypothetical protein
VCTTFSSSALFAMHSYMSTSCCTRSGWTWVVETWARHSKAVRRIDNTRFKQFQATIVSRKMSLSCEKITPEILKVKSIVYAFFCRNCLTWTWTCCVINNEQLTFSTVFILYIRLHIHSCTVVVLLNLLI